MILYHGSTHAIEAPGFPDANRTLDFGMGFYATVNHAQASDIAGVAMSRRRACDQAVSCYGFDMERAEKELRILKFAMPDESWFDFICQNRQGKDAGNAYDIIIGPVADDKVYATIGFFESRVLTREQAIDSLRINPLPDQIVLKTKAALELLKFREAYDPREVS